MRILGIALIGLVVGCGSGAAVPTGSSVVEVQVTRDAERVQILGLDARRAPVGEIIVRVGDYVDIESLDPTPVHGRLLAATVGTLTVTHQAPLQAELQLPLVESRLTPDFLAFITDPRVDAALAAEQVRTRVVDSLDAQVPAQNASVDESAFLACTFGASSSCGAGDCYQYSATPATQHRCCEGSGQAVERLCTGIPAGCAGGSSSNPSSNSCGAVGCFGCSVCPGSNTFAYVGSCIIDSNGKFWDQGTHCKGTATLCTADYQCCYGATCQGQIGNQKCGTPP